MVSSLFKENKINKNKNKNNAYNMKKYSFIEWVYSIFEFKYIIIPWIINVSTK